MNDISNIKETKQQQPTNIITEFTDRIPVNYQFDHKKSQPHNKSKSPPRDYLKGEKRWFRKGKLSDTGINKLSLYQVKQSIFLEFIFIVLDLS